MKLLPIAVIVLLLSGCAVNQANYNFKRDSGWTWGWAEKVDVDNITQG